MNNFRLHTHTHKVRLTVWSPDKANSEEVLQVIEQNIFDLKVFFHPDGTWTACSHDKPRAIQTDAGEPGKMEDTAY